MPSKKSSRMKKSARMKMKTLAWMKKSTRLTGEFGAWAIALVAICVMAAAMLIAARQSPPPADIARMDERPVEAAVPVVAKTVVDEPEVATAPAAAKGAPVTITGCLERADESFRLKDTTGANVPTSRSWKSGFLKKRSASVDLVDKGNRVKLADHVGRRVSVTGTLVDREMQVRSLQRLAPSCSAPSRVKI